LVLDPYSLVMSMATRRFEDLRVYRLAESLADDVWSIVLQWGNFQKDTVGKQLVRAADSIGANIAEGTGRRSFQDNRRFVKIARGSLGETEHWLRRAFKRSLLSEAQVAALEPLVDDLGPCLNAYLNSIGRGKLGTKD
jgi:four helix bundle protein